MLKKVCQCNIFNNLWENKEDYNESVWVFLKLNH